MRSTLHHDALRGLEAVSLIVRLREQGCGVIFIPLLKTKLATSIHEHLTKGGIIVNRNVTTQLIVEVKPRVVHLPNAIVGISRVETVLREPVTILRNGLKCTVDTWRHRTVVRAYAGQPAQLSELTEGEALRQVDAFVGEYKSIKGVAVDEPVAVDSPRVTQAKKLLAAGAAYPKGCSEFITSVLGIAWEDANSIMGNSPTYVGDNNTYPGLVPGDIVGWKVGGGNGHVAVYVGEPGTKFIDVRESGGKPRRVMNGYGIGKPLFKSSKY
jgi:hypothetical protein